MSRLRKSMVVAILTGAPTLASTSCGHAVLDFPGDVEAGAPAESEAGIEAGSSPDATISCPANKVLCGSSCVSLISDPLHCGACNARCDGQTPVCNLGACRPSCTSGLSSCAGACLDLRSDPEHCGDCTLDCGSGGCTRGECVCLTGQVLCGKRCVDTANDRSNCGTCGRSCPASAVCRAGVCN